MSFGTHRVYQADVYLLKLYSHFAYMLHLLQYFEVENVYGSM